MSQDAVSLRLAIDGVHAAMAQLRDVEQKLKDLGPAAKKGTNDAARALATLKTAVADVQRAHASAAGRISGAWNGVAGALRGSAVAAASVAGAFAGVLKIVQQFDKAQGFRRTLKLNLGDAVGGALARDVDKFAIRQGAEINSTRQGAAQLAGAGVAGDQILPTLKAFMALAARSGATGEGSARAFYQYTQIASQGKLQGDELRAIQENGVQLLRLLKDAGLGERIGSQTNPLTFEEINAVLIKALDSPESKRALEEQRKQASTQWQAAMDYMQVNFLEPLGEQMAPAVRDISDYVIKLTKDADPRAVAQFVKNLVEGGIKAAEWIKNNQELIKNIGIAIVGFRGLALGVGLVKDALVAKDGLKAAVEALKAYLQTMTGGNAIPVPGGKSGTGGGTTVIPGGGGSGTGGKGGKGASGKIGELLLMGFAAVLGWDLGTAIFENFIEPQTDKLNKEMMDKLEEAFKGASLERLNKLRAKLGLPSEGETTWQRRDRMASEGRDLSAESFSRKAQQEWNDQYGERYGTRPSHDAMGRKLSYGITRAEQNATFAHMLARSLR